jgi:hypothetical protein
MKYDQLKAFPYPVLRPGSDDYKDGDFQATVDPTADSEKITVRITYAISCDEIKREIANGNAIFSSIVSCRDTYFEGPLSTPNDKIESDFSIKDLRGEVRVESYVVVVNEIKGYTSPDLNPEFGSIPFSFSPGDILAQDEPQVFYIDRDLFKPVTSVFELVSKEHLNDGEWTVSFEQPHVQIEVSPQMKDSIDEARNSTEKRVVLLNSLYFAAVMQAIQRLKEAPEDYDDYKWAVVIQRQLHNRGLDLITGESSSLAQKLMKYPLSLLETYILKGMHS